MKRLVTSIAAVMLVVSGLMTFGVATAGAAGPTLVLTPNTQLFNGDKVVITGSGFPAGASVAAVECNGASLGLSSPIEGCSVTSPVLMTVNGDGTLPATNFFVQTGAIGNGTCGTSASDAQCFIAVGTPTGTLLGYNTIGFQGVTVTPASALVGGQKVMVSGFGFNPTDSVTMIQCLLTAQDISGCNVAGAVTGLTTDSNGNLAPTSFTIASGTIGTGTCSSAKNPNGCAILVSNANGTDAAAAAISLLGPRTVKVSPTTGLKNKSTVKVSGSGFTPGDHVYLVECLVGSTSPSKCDLKTLKAATITSAGVLNTTSFKVVTGKVGTGICGTTKANLKKCDISVANASKGDSKVVNITFALPKKKK